MRILVIQHSAADGPATIGQWLDSAGADVQTVRIDRNDPIPETVDADLLMMFGGAISLARSEHPPWIAQEQELIRRYVLEGRRVLGVCLGAQLLASALGANVYRNEQPEVGWHPVRRVTPWSDSANAVADVFPAETHVLQWHRDTFEIPRGSTRLMESEACGNQAFCIDNRVFGFQFHIEANQKTVMTFLAASRLHRKQAPFVQDESQIINGIEKHLRRQQAMLKKFLQRFLLDDG